MEWEVNLLERPTLPELVEDEEQLKEVQQILGVDIPEDILKDTLVAEEVEAPLVVSLFEQRRNFGDQQLLFTLRLTVTETGCKRWEKYINMLAQTTQRPLIGFKNMLKLREERMVPERPGFVSFLQ